ncbi:MAG: glucose PTS transporter subunit IIA, partial [Lactovum sp.]
PLIGAASFAQTGMVFAIWLKTKNKKLKNIAFPAWISGIFGVTEPAIYGVTLPKMKYFIMTCIVSGIGGALIGMMKVKQYVMAGLGIFSFPGYFSTEESSSAIVIIIVCLLSTVVAALVGLIMYKDEEKYEEVKVEELIKETESILSPLEGHVRALNTVEDAAFSEALLGQGIAIEPSQGLIVSPFNGTVVTLFPTKHAIGLISDTGCEVLIHVGMDTVKLEGKYFESFVEQGAKVLKGEKLVTFDIEAIKTAGYSVLTPVIVTNTADYLDVVPVAENNVSINDEILKVMV